VRAKGKDDERRIEEKIGRMQAAAQRRSQVSPTSAR